MIFWETYKFEYPRKMQIAMEEFISLSILCPKGDKSHEAVSKSMRKHMRVCLQKFLQKLK